MYGAAWWCIVRWCMECGGGVRWCMECCTVVYGVCWCTVVCAVWLLLNISSGKVPERKPKTHNDPLDVLTGRGWRKCDAIDALKDSMSNGEEDIVCSCTVVYGRMCVYFLCKMTMYPFSKFSHHRRNTSAYIYSSGQSQ